MLPGRVQIQFDPPQRSGADGVDGIAHIAEDIGPARIEANIPVGEALETLYIAVEPRVSGEPREGLIAVKARNGGAGIDARLKGHPHGVDIKAPVR